MLIYVCINDLFTNILLFSGREVAVVGHAVCATVTRVDALKPLELQLRHLCCSYATSSSVRIINRKNCNDRWADTGAAVTLLSTGILTRLQYGVWNCVNLPGL